jgi:hypothetical protein
MTNYGNGRAVVSLLISDPRLGAERDFHCKRPLAIGRQREETLER